MRLESIVLHGFKSFAEKTTVRILPGITGIVGPNGCGKSNISEAIRWALGEQSAKSLRGARMEDLIFHGSASRKPVGLAEVELMFSNDGALDVPWSEVAVSRRLYRTAESEYLLNGNACRLRDILDLLAGTGASPRAYSVMDQEKLNHVLTAKPYERRIFIEEAAGIARYKQQRSETQGKLDATRQNLLRVRDVMDEVRRQLGSLERQAKKAQQYKVLHGEKQSLARALVAADYAALAAEGARLQAELDRLGDGERDLRVRQSALGAREATRRAAQEEMSHRLGDLRQSVQKIQGEVERLLERREQMGIQIRELEEEEQRLTGEIRLAEERSIAVASERSAAAAALGEAEALATARARASGGRSRRCWPTASPGWPRRRHGSGKRASRWPGAGRASRRSTSSSVRGRATAPACGRCSPRRAPRAWPESSAPWLTCWRCRSDSTRRSRPCSASGSSGSWSSASSTPARRWRCSRASARARRP